MNKLHFFLVTYDRLYDKVVENLTPSEIECITCYNVQKKVTKQISSLIKNEINEWELPWNLYDFQKKQVYEYGTMVHLYKNPNILDGITHVGILHYDVVFNKGSVDDIQRTISTVPDTIFYQKIRTREQLSLSFFEVSKLCEFMSERLGQHIDPNIPWESGWISESLSVTPKEVFLKFAEFLHDYINDIENILRNNIWNIMNHCPHRMCGIIERMWGFYLVNQNLPLKQMNIIHDWDSYNHEHMKMNGTGVATL
jgi:hypothetical protein